MITIVVVDDALGYLTREVVGCDIDWFSRRTKSGTPLADGFNVVRDFRSILGRSATLTCDASTAATGAALLASGISAGWCH